MTVVVARPLTAEAYAPYGHVLAAGIGSARVANQGTAQRFDRVLPLLDHRPGVAALNVSVFRSQPRAERPFEVALLEKHPLSTQLFVPMGARRYLVIVALGGERPDLATLAAFVATGRQGVSYAPGVWHHPLVALDEETDFACFVHEADDAGDCTEHALPASARPRVLVPEGTAEPAEAQRR